MLCSRCHGTLLGCPCWQALVRLGSSWHAWHAVSRRPERSGGFLWRWDHRLQRPSLRAGLGARHPMLSASFDDCWQAQRRRPHLYDGVRRRPGIFSGRLHPPSDRGVTLHRHSVSAAPPTCEVKRYGTSDHRNDGIAVSPRGSSASHLTGSAFTPLCAPPPPVPPRSRGHARAQ